MHRKLSTNDNLKIRGCTPVSICGLCDAIDETSSHLFLSCDFAVNLWHWLGSKMDCFIQLSSVSSVFECIHVNCSS